MICSRKEFEELCGISRGNYTTYRGRKKIYEQQDDDGNIVIDTDHPINSAFYSSRKEIVDQKKRDEVIQEVVPKPKYQESPKNKAKEPEQKKPVTKVSKSNDEDESETKKYWKVKQELELEGFKNENRRKEAAAINLELKNETLLGNNVPMPIVKEAFSLLGKQLLTGYKAYIEQEVNNFCHKHKISDRDRIDMLAKLTSGLNITHTKSVRDGESMLKAEFNKYKIKDSLSDGLEDN